MSDVPQDVLEIPVEIRERLRAAVAQLVGNRQSVSNRAVKALAGGSSGHVAAVVRAFKGGFLDVREPWGDELEGGGVTDDADAVTGLIEQIRCARGPGDLAAVCSRTLELVVAGTISDARGRTIRDLCQEQRRALDDARKVEPPPEDPTKLLLASAEAMQVARLMDLLVDDEIRDEIIAFAANAMERDLEKHPCADEGGA